MAEPYRLVKSHVPILHNPLLHVWSAPVPHVPLWPPDRQQELPRLCRCQLQLAGLLLLWGYRDGKTDRQTVLC